MIGTLGDVVFAVSSLSTLTPNNIKRSSGSKWASHERLNKKTRTEYLAPELSKISFDIQLKADMGVRPRKTIDKLIAMAEGSEAYLLTIGCAPMGDNYWRITGISDEWDTIFSNGELYSAKVSISLEEYV